MHKYILQIGGDTNKLLKNEYKIIANNSTKLNITNCHVP